jgi:hypothetical protein
MSEGGDETASRQYQRTGATSDASCTLPGVVFKKRGLVGNYESSIKCLYCNQWMRSNYVHECSPHFTTCPICQPLNATSVPSSSTPPTLQTLAS